MAAKLIDLTNVRFGKLLVKRKVGNCRQGRSLWLCVCECGNEITTVSASLRNGLTKSCGCVKKERHSEESLAQVKIAAKLSAFEKGRFLGVRKRGSLFYFSIMMKSGEVIKQFGFKTGEEAALAYDRFAVERDGINAVLNFPNMSEFEE